MTPLRTGGMRLVAVLLGAVLVPLTDLPAVGTGLRTVAATEPAASPDFLSALSKAKRLRDDLDLEDNPEAQKKLEEDFLRTVRARLADFAVLAPHAAKTPGKFAKLTLNRHGKGFDAFRFRAPASDGKWDLEWEFLVPEARNFGGWYILAAEGELQGFMNFQSRRDYRVEGTELPAKNFAVLQSLPGGQLRGGKEYVIWFTFDDDQPLDFWIRLRMQPTPPGPKILDL